MGGKLCEKSNAVESSEMRAHKERVGDGELVEISKQGDSLKRPEHLSGRTSHSFGVGRPSRLNKNLEISKDGNKKHTKRRSWAQRQHMSVIQSARFKGIREREEKLKHYEEMFENRRKGDL